MAVLVALQSQQQKPIENTVTHEIDNLRILKVGEQCAINKANLLEEYSYSNILVYIILIHICIVLICLHSTSIYTYCAI